MADARDLPLFAFGETLRRDRRRRRMLRRRGLWLALGVAALGLTIAFPPRPRLLWNASASAPIGLYRVGAGAAPMPGNLVVVWLPEPARRLAAERLLARPPRARPDAIFAANDLIALGVLQALIRAGVRVPDDIALIGYDDIYFASAAAIPLSSIRQPAADIGRTAAEVLLHEIENPDEGEYRHVVFQPELVIRESTA